MWNQRLTQKSGGLVPEEVPVWYAMLNQVFGGCNLNLKDAKLSVPVHVIGCTWKS